MFTLNASTLFYLKEIRRRLLYVVLVFFIIFLFLFYFANQLYTILAMPLLAQLPHNQKLLATQPLSAFFAPMNLVFYMSIFITMPLALYQIWSFIAPALYSREKKMIWPFLFFSILFFYLGMVFCYYVVFPFLFSFLAHNVPAIVQLAPDINSYLELALQLFLIFGCIFQTPIIITLLIKMQIITVQHLRKFRPYAILSAFILAMLLGPPDILSQILLAVPMWLLYELGLWISAIFL